MLENYRKIFFNTAVSDIYRAINGRSLTGAFILNFCLIDYLNWIEFEGQVFGFNKWIKKRLLPLNPNYDGKDEELYRVRNGLVHSYGPSNNILKGKFSGYLLWEQNPAFHLQRHNSDVLNICLYSLLTETVFATHQMFEELEINATPEQLHRMSQQIKISGHVPKLYSHMHIALSSLDHHGVTLAHIKGDYTKYILYPS